MTTHNKPINPSGLFKQWQSALLYQYSQNIATIPKHPTVKETNTVPQYNSKNLLYLHHGPYLSILLGTIYRDKMIWHTYISKYVQICHSDVTFSFNERRIWLIAFVPVINYGSFTKLQLLAACFNWGVFTVKRSGHMGKDSWLRL